MLQFCIRFSLGVRFFFINTHLGAEKGTQNNEKISEWNPKSKKSHKIEGSKCIWCIKKQWKIYIESNLLNIQKWKCNGFPKIITIFACHFEMFVKFFFNQWIILHCNCVPHEVLQSKLKFEMKIRHTRQTNSFEIIQRNLWIRIRIQVRHPITK